MEREFESLFFHKIEQTTNIINLKGENIILTTCPLEIVNSNQSNLFGLLVDDDNKGNKELNIVKSAGWERKRGRTTHDKT